MTRLLPAPGVSRSLVLQSTIYSTGAGTFLAGSAAYFVEVIGLTPQQAGLGLSIAGLVSFATAVPLGMFTDRVGALRIWQLSAFAEAVLFALYPAVRGFVGFVVLVVCLAIALSAGNGGRGAYTIAVLPKELRVETMAYARSALNIGFALGAGFAGAMIAINQPWAYHAMPFFNAVMIAVGGVLVLRLPRVPYASPAPRRPGAFRVLRDAPFMAVSAVNGMLQVHATLLVVVVPLWLIVRTDAPRVTLAVLFAMNTITVIALQVYASRGADTVTGAAKVLRRAGIMIAAGCAVLAVSGDTSGALTVAVLILGYLLLTGGELYQSAGQWGLSAELPPPARRAEYLGGMRLGGEAQRMAGPVVLMGVTMAAGVYGWLAVCVFVLAIGFLSVPAASWACRRRLAVGTPSAEVVSSP